MASVVQFWLGLWVAEEGCLREPAMLKIARVEDGASDSIPTLKLEGKLVGPWVVELSRACEELPTPPSGLRLNLSAVTFIDSAGITVLDDLTRRGATIAGCSGFIAELLGRSRS